MSATLRWSTTALAALVCGIGLVCLVNGARRVGRPFPGFLVAENRIVVSIGRPTWSIQNAEHVLFAKVIGIEGLPITTAQEIETHVAHLPVGTAVTYRFRRQAEVFTAVAEVQRFGVTDFLTLYGAYFVTGLCFTLAGWWALRRRHGAATTAFFVVCQSAGLVLLTGGDVYGPYWFTPLYFTAHCLTPAAILLLAGSYPETLGAGSRWRHAALALLYAGSLGIALALNLVSDDPSLFLPLIYSVYLLLANALLLYLGRLAIALWSATDAAQRGSLRRALAGVLLSATVPGVIFVIYPVLKSPISPMVLAAPLAIFPLFTLAALRHLPAPVVPARGTSVRLRLALLFLGAVETAFLAGIAVFWLNTSWKELIDDLTVNQRQVDLAERFLGRPPAESTNELRALEARLQTTTERHLVAAASAALTRNDPAAAAAAIEQLVQRYREVERRLDVRRERLSRFDAALVLSLVVIGVLQAVGFMIAIQRWLIRPVDQLAEATSVIATGDLGHRVQLDSAREFVTLADSINAMAASLAKIQQRIDAEREACHRAAAAARDAERRRLAHELHDGTLQDLSAVKLHLERAQRGTPAAPLQASVDAIIQIIVGLRRVVDDFGAPDLSHSSLGEAIAAYAQVLAQGHGVTLQVDLPPTIEVADWASRDVYRIAQEGIANAVRHGAPARLSIRLRPNQGHSVLEIHDDGVGFDLQTATLGTGIVGMRERATAIGARLEILTAPGTGTTVRLTLPPTLARP